MTDAPERIWLQWVEPHHAENTWCEDQINDHDIEYVRADLSTYAAGFAAGIEAAARYCETHTMEIAMRAADRKFAGMFVAGEPFGGGSTHHGMGSADALRALAEQE